MMTRCLSVALALALLFCTDRVLAAGSGNQAAEILEVDLATGTAVGAATPSWLRYLTFHGGQNISRDGHPVWTVDQKRPVGEGRVDLWLNRDALPDALAVVVVFDPIDGTDLAIQLYDAQDQLVAVDLFGNLAETRTLGGSDTFVIPMRKYPTAVRVSIRRITGPLALTGLAAFPVIEELESLSRAEEAAFERLLAGADLQMGNQVFSDSTQGLLRVRRERELKTSNAIADKILGAPGYPRSTFQSGDVSGAPFSLFVSGTAYRFVTNILMKMFPESKDFGDQLMFTSSSHASDALAENQTKVAVVSRLPSTEQIEQFRARNGFHPIIIPIALDAVEVIVNPANGLNQIDYAGLRTIFGNQDDASDLDWVAIPGASLTGTVQPVGGQPTWGTSRTFADLIGLHERFSDSLVVRDIAFPHGVEKFVSENRNAIGFAQYRPRQHAVKSVDIIPAAGAEPIGISADTVYGGTYPFTRQLFLVLGWSSTEDLPSAVKTLVDLLLSHQGQTEVALAGNFPLDSSSVMAARRELASK